MSPTAPSADEAGARPTATLRLDRATDAPAAPAEDRVGRVLAGRYELLREVGRGGMGIVYQARHVALGRAVAVKVLRPELARSDDALVRFEREAKAAAAIGAPGIVEVLDFGREASGEAWMVMEFLDGEDLAARIRRSGPQPEDAVRAMLRDVALALRDAHAKGIVHRDLKSENLLLVRRGDRDRVKVVDFGISRVAAESALAEADFGIVGTPHYMAPELADPSAPSDHRVDLYALGCIAFEALTGRLPFTGADPAAVLAQHATAPVPRPRDHARVSLGLDAIVRRLLAKRPDDRFADAAALLDALARDARRRADAVRLGALAVLATLLGTLVATRAPPPRTPAPPPPLAPPSPVAAPVSPDLPAPQRIELPTAFTTPLPAPEPRAVPRRRLARPAALRADAGEAPPRRTGPDNLKLSPYAPDR